MFFQKCKNLFLKYKEIILYIIFGVLTTVVNFVVYTPLTNMLGAEHTVLGIPWYLYTTVIAWIAAVLFAIVGFIVCGFEHSIADMGYLAIAIPNLSFWQILQCMGMILVIMLGNVFGGKLMRMVLVDWQEKEA